MGVEDNPYSLPLQCLFSMAARNNPKRSFLFVSKLIGKHIPVLPTVPFAAGSLLAAGLAQELGLAASQETIRAAINLLVHGIDCRYQTGGYYWPGKILFIGFAETATALGHAVFHSFTGNVNYLHTTREPLSGSRDTICFSEEHSHAPDHSCLICDETMMQDNDLIVLIDDEITTGNTCLNIIQTMQRKYPQKRYAVLTILDWRTPEAIAKYHQLAELWGIQIDVISLVKGSFRHQGKSPVIHQQLRSIEEDIPCVQILRQSMGHVVPQTLPDGQPAGYLQYTGRFGLEAGQVKPTLLAASKAGSRLAQLRRGKKTLCLATGEFMYIPFLIANHMGPAVMVSSTTRSPVHPHLRDDYAIKHAIAFEDPFRPGSQNFVYNIPPDYYDEVFVFWERKVLPGQVVPLVHALKKLGVQHIVFVYFCN